MQLPAAGGRAGMSDRGELSAITEEASPAPVPKARRRRSLVALLLFVVFCLIVYTQLTLFVVQPIGAVPEGATLVIARLQGLHFIDSADAFCERESGGVNLLCRAAVLGKVAEESRVIVRLPYSQTLYVWSTGGVTHDR
jgi:hypothetical protein